MCALIVIAALLQLPLPTLVATSGSGYLGRSSYSFSRAGSLYVALFKPPLSGELQLMGAMARLVNEAYGPGLIEDITVRSARVGKSMAGTWRGKHGYTYFFVPARGSRGEIVGMMFWRDRGRGRT